MRYLEDTAGPGISGDATVAEASTEAAKPLVVPIAKGGASIEVFTRDLPDNVYQAALLLGLKDLLNRGMTKVKSPKNLQGEDKAKAQAAAMEIATKNAESLRAGKLPRIAGVKTGDDKIPGVVMTEARRLAKNLIKDEIKAAGGKISHYEAKDITAAANAYLETDEGKGLIEQAKANVEARTKVVEAKVPAKSEEALAAVQSKLGLAVSAKKVAEAEKAKAKKKEAGESILSAAKAGQIKSRSKGKGSQPTA